MNKNDDIVHPPWIGEYAGGSPDPSADPPAPWVSEPLPSPPPPAPVPEIVEPGEPWNVINMRAAHAAAVNNYVKVEEEFDANFVEIEDVPTPLEAAPEPVITKISAGWQLYPDPDKYVIDHKVAARAEHRHESD